MKKYILGVAMLLAVYVVPVSVQAQTTGLTQGQITAIISILQAFNADSSVIENVRVSLGGGIPTPGQSFCHTFASDLTVGSNGAEVLALNQALMISGVNTTGNTSFFDENTAGDVVAFQAKYGIRQTGYVGPLTRGKLNALYSCGDQHIQPPHPATEFTVGPTSGAAPLSVSFAVRKDSLSGVNTLDFGDGASASTSGFTCGLEFCSVNHTYNSPGSYSAHLTRPSACNAIAAGTACTQEIIDTVTITVSPMVTTACTAPHITAPPSSSPFGISPGQSGVSLPLSADQPVSYSLQNAPSWVTLVTATSLTADSVSFGAVPVSPGTYSFTIVATNGCGKSDILTIPLIVSNGSAVIDQSSLFSSSLTPTISGTASADAGAVGITISNSTGKIYGSGIIGNSGGRWSVTVSPALSPGTYSVNVYNYFSNALLTTATLTVSSGMMSGY